MDEEVISVFCRVARLEGWDPAYSPQVEGANLIKLHRGTPQVSYLSYPDFE